MMKQFAFLILSLFFFMGCSDRDDDLNGVHIRVKNNSGQVFDQVQVGETDKLHKNIAPESFSDYLEYAYGTVYRYAYIAITVGEENYILQITDFVGEVPLERGFYTYALNVSEEGVVQLDLIAD